jgi:hypothetical protein
MLSSAEFSFRKSRIPRVCSNSSDDCLAFYHAVALVMTNTSLVHCPGASPRVLLRLCRQPTRSKQDALVGGEWTCIRYEQWQNKLKRNRKSPLLLQNIRSSTVRKGNSPQSGFVNMAYHKTPFLLPPASVHSFPY